MKHHAQTSADGFTLDIVYPMHPLWSQVIEACFSALSRSILCRAKTIYAGVFNPH